MLYQQSIIDTVNEMFASLKSNDYKAFKKLCDTLDDIEENVISDHENSETVILSIQSSEKNLKDLSKLKSTIVLLSTFRIMFHRNIIYFRAIHSLILENKFQHSPGARYRSVPFRV